MVNPRKVYVSEEKNEEVYVFSGRVFKVTDRGSYASVSFAKEEKEGNDVELISVMCFTNNAGIGPDHKKIAMNAEQIRQTLSGDEVLFATIVAIKQLSPDGKVNFKARSTSFCITEKNKYFAHKNPVRAYFKPEQSSNFCLMSGYVSRVFENEKYNSCSFRADTENKDAGFVSARCFHPFDKEKARMDCLENATAINELLSNGDSVHCVVTCLKTVYQDKAYYNALTVSYAVRVR